MAKFQEKNLTNQTGLFNLGQLYYFKKKNAEEKNSRFKTVEKKATGHFTVMIIVIPTLQLLNRRGTG